MIKKLTGLFTKQPASNSISLEMAVGLVVRGVMTDQTTTLREDIQGNIIGQIEEVGENSATAVHDYFLVASDAVSKNDPMEYAASFCAIVLI